MSADWSCTVQYLYTIDHAVEKIAYQRFKLISVTLLYLICTVNNIQIVQQFLRNSTASMLFFFK